MEFAGLHNPSDKMRRTSVWDNLQGFFFSEIRQSCHLLREREYSKEGALGIGKGREENVGQFPDKLS